MKQGEVRIVKLEPLHVASVHGFGQQPEHEAWDMMRAWAGPRGYLDDPEEHPIFGFNNPNPSPGSPNYGYEFWIQVGEEVEPEADIEIKDFPGGLYAVARWPGDGDPYQEIPAAWRRLVLWREKSRYRAAHHQWLERHLDVPDAPEGRFALDLYLPIAE